MDSKNSIMKIKELGDKYEIEPLLATRRITGPRQIPQFVGFLWFRRFGDVGYVTNIAPSKKVLRHKLADEMIKRLSGHGITNDEIVLRPGKVYNPMMFGGFDIDSLSSVKVVKLEAQMIDKNNEQGVSTDSPNVLKDQDSGGADQLTIQQSGQTALSTQRGEAHDNAAEVQDYDASKFYNEIVQEFPQVCDRFYLVNEATWSKNDALGKIIFSESLLAEFSNLTGFDTSKTLPITTLLRTYEYVRPQMKIKVQLSTPPMSGGQLVVGFRYFDHENSNVLQGATKVRHAYQITQMPHVILNAQASNVGEVEIPFQGPWDWLPTRDRNELKGLFYVRMYIGVLNPFICTGTGDARIRVYCSFSNSHGQTQFMCLRALENTMGGNPNKVAYVQPKSLEAEKVSAQGLLDFLGPLKKPLIESVPGILSNLDRPAVNDDNKQVQVQGTPNLSLGSGPIDVKKMAVSDTTVTPHEGSALSRRDEFNVSYLSKIYAPMYNAKLTSNMFPGQLIKWNDGFSDCPCLPVTPIVQYTMKGFSGDLADADYWIFEPCMTTLARYFTYYTGSIKYKFVFGTALGHGLRIRVYYRPDYYSTMGDSAGNYPYVVFDVKEQTEFEFVAPYMATTKAAPIFTTTRREISTKQEVQRFDWLSARGRSRGGNTLHFANGAVQVEIETPLTHPDSLPDYVWCTVMVAAGDDFELFVPNTDPSPFFTYKEPKPKTLTAQVSTPGEVSKDNVDERHRDKTAVNVFGNKISIKGIQYGDNYDLKDVCRRFNYYYGQRIGRATSANSVRVIMPVYVGPQVFGNGEDLDLVSLLSLGFRFYKGSMRYAIQFQSPEQNSMMVHHQPETSPQFLYEDDSDNSKFNFATLLDNNTLAVQGAFNTHIQYFDFYEDWKDGSKQMRKMGWCNGMLVNCAVEASSARANEWVTVEVPWTSNYNCNLNNFVPRSLHDNDAFDGIYYGQLVNNGSLVVTCRGENNVKGDLTILRALGDDGHFYCFQGFPLRCDYSPSLVCFQGRPLSTIKTEDFRLQSLANDELVRLEAQMFASVGGMVTDTLSFVGSTIYESLKKLLVSTLSAVLPMDSIIKIYDEYKDKICMDIAALLVADSVVSSISGLVRLLYDIGIIPIGMTSAAICLLISFGTWMMKPNSRGTVYLKAQAFTEDDLTSDSIKWVQFLAPLVFGYMSFKSFDDQDIISKFGSYFREVFAVGNSFHLFVQKNFDLIRDLVDYALGNSSYAYRQLVKVSDSATPILAWADNIVTITNPKVRKNVLTSNRWQRKVIDLKVEGDKYLLDVDHMPVEYKSAFQILYKKIYSLYEEVATIIGSAEAAIEPIVCWMAGVPGCGKSTIMDHLSMEVMKSLEVVYDGPAIFTRNFVDYWNGYRGQPVVKYDDFTFNTSDENMNRLVNEIQCLASVAPFNAPMAAIEDKLMLVNAKLVMIGANQLFINSKAIGNATAFHRRRDFLIYVDYHPDFKEQYPNVFASGNPVSYGLARELFNLPKSDASTGFQHLAFYVLPDPVAEIPEEAVLQMHPMTYGELKDWMCRRAKSIMRNRSNIGRGIHDISYECSPDKWIERGPTASVVEDINAMRADFGEEAIYVDAQMYGIPSYRRLVVEEKEIAECELPYGVMDVRDSEPLNQEQLSKVRFAKSYACICQLPFVRKVTVCGVPRGLLYGLNDTAAWVNIDCLCGVVCPVDHELESELCRNRIKEFVSSTKNVMSRIGCLLRNGVSVCMRNKLKSLGLCFALGSVVAVASRFSDSRNTCESQLASSGSVPTRKVNLKVKAAKTKVLQVKQAQGSSNVDWNRKSLRSAVVIEALGSRMSGFGMKARKVVLPHHFFLKIKQCIDEVPIIDVEEDLWKRLRNRNAIEFEEEVPTFIRVRFGGKVYNVEFEKLDSGEVKPLFCEVDDYIIRVYYMCDSRIPVSKCFYSNISLSAFEDMDLCVAEFPPTVSPFPDVSHLIARPNVLVGDCGATMYEVDPHSLCIREIRFHDLKKTDMRVCYDNVDGMEYQLRGFEYNYSKKGLCGSILVDNRTGHIIGMHVAGSSKVGYSTRLPYDELVEALGTLTYEEPEFDAVESGLVGDFLVFGRSGMSAHPPVTNDIVPSLVNAQFESTRYPVKLTSEFDNKPGDYFMKKAIETSGHPPDPIPECELALVKDNMTTLFTSIPVKHTVKSVRSLEEAIYGSKDLDYMVPLKLNTSLGLPLSMQFPGKQKKDLIIRGESSFKVHKQVLDALNSEHDKRTSGVVPMGEYLMFLKAERLKPGKDPRPISGSSVQSILEWRRYTCDFIDYIQRNREHFGIMIGMNVWGYDWNNMSKRLLSVGDKILCGDHKRFGPRLSPYFVRMFGEVMNAWYRKFTSATEEDCLIRTILVEELCNCNVVAYDTTIRMLCGSPSGAYCTAVINSFVNMCYMKYVWMKVFEGRPLSDLSYFHNYTRFCFYGDDLVAGISDKVIEEYNNETIQQKLRLIGLDYTDADKTLDQIRKYVKLEDATFLKCHFIKHPTRPGVWQSAMEWSVIEELPAWIHRCEDSRVATIENLKTASRFAYSHGPEVYSQFKARVSEALAQLGDYTILPNWNTIDHECYEEGKFVDELNY